MNNATNIAVSHISALGVIVLKAMRRRCEDQTHEILDYTEIGHNHEHLTRVRGLSRSWLTTILRDLKEQGLVIFCPNLTNDDGEYRGAGHILTRLGIEKLEGQG